MSLRLVVSLLVASVGSLLLWGCSSTPYFVAEKEPWREQEEQACLAANVVRETRFVQARSALGGPSVCGALRPFEMAGTADGRISLKPAAMLRCPMVPAVEHWMATTIEPAARMYLGSPIVEVKVAASYGCRPMNHQVGGRLSEHGHANALDVSGFQTADGRFVSVKDGWYGDRDERAFLRAVHAGACHTFTTVLGPEYDRLHRDHFHVDLAKRGPNGTGRICK
jgi:hypothetical protein